MNKLTQQTKRTITYLVTALAIFAMGSDARAHGNHPSGVCSHNFQRMERMTVTNGITHKYYDSCGEQGVSHGDFHNSEYRRNLAPICTLTGCIPHPNKE